MIISVEHTLKLHYYTVQKVFSASLFPIFLCYSLIPKWIPFFFPPLHPTPHAYFGDAALAATRALARLPAAPWLVWGFYGCGSALFAFFCCRPSAICITLPPLLRQSALSCRSQQLAAPLPPPPPPSLTQPLARNRSESR